MYVIGIDIGGTTTSFGLVTSKGEVVKYGVIPTTKHTDFSDYVKELSDEIKKLVSETEYKGKIRGIGVGAPMANYYEGTIENAVNLPWGFVNLRDEIRKHFPDVPVAVTNDANAATVGEMSYGAARGMKDFIMLTLGTGIGSGIVVNGKLVLGCDGFAGELGHRSIKKVNARQCSCGNIGCLETYCSARGMARTAREMLELRKDDSILRKYNPEEVTSKEVYLAAKEGDKLALEIFEYTGEILGDAVADMVTFSSPEAVIFFGGLANSGDLLLDPVRRSLEAHVLPVFRGHTKVLKSLLPESEAAILGASALGWEVAQKDRNSE